MKLEDSHEKSLSAGERAVERLVHLVGGKGCRYITVTPGHRGKPPGYTL